MQQPSFDWQLPPFGEQTQLVPLTRLEQQPRGSAPRPKLTLAPVGRHLQLPLPSTASEQQDHGSAGFPEGAPLSRQVQAPLTEAPVQQPWGLPLSGKL
jgi:hypothetical protein